MKTAKRKQNRLQLGIRAEQLPRSVTPFRYFKGLLESLDTGSDLPERWRVLIRWRNPETRSGRTKYWQEDDFADAVSQSNDGFRSVLRNMLTTYLYRARYEPKKIQRKPVIRKKVVIRRFEKMLEEVDERKKRSAAAKRGWETRRAN